MQVDIKSSSIRFLYPFRFDMDEFDSRVQVANDATWPGSRQPMKLWQPMDFSAQDLPSYLSDLLNPPDPNTRATARLWSIEKNAFKSKLGGGVKQPGAYWSLIHPRGTIPFCLEAIQLILFQTGVGFLSVCAKPTSNSLADWQDFLHYFRFMDNERLAEVSAQRRGMPTIAQGQVVKSPKGEPRQKIEAELVPFFPEVAGGLGKRSNGKVLFGDIVYALLQTAIPVTPVTSVTSVTAEASEASEALPSSKEVEKTKESGGRKAHEIFMPGQLLPFATLYVDGIPKSEIPQLLYRVRNFFWSKQGSNPAPEDLHLDHPSLLTYAERMWFVFSLDGGAFVACDAPTGDNPAAKFFRETMPAHLDDQYFLTFLLALHQRFVLMMLSSEVAARWPIDDGKESDEDASKRDKERAETFERIRRAMFSFTARGYFAQVMQQEHHHRCYKKWQETFEVPRLYQEVSHEISDMHNWLQARHTERLQKLAEDQKNQLEDQRRRAEDQWRETQKQWRQQQQQIEEQRKLSEDQHHQTEQQWRQSEERWRQRQLKDEAQKERSQRLERALGFAVGILGVPAVALTFLQTLGTQPLEVSLRVGFSALVIGIIGVIIFWIINHFIEMRAARKKTQD